MLTLILLTLVFLLNFLARIIFSPLLPALEQDLAISHTLAGSFFLIMSCGYFLSLLGSGFIASFLGHKKTILFSMACLITSLFLLSSTTSVPLIQLSFFLLGGAAGPYLPSAIGVISSVFPAHQWGRAFGVHELAPNLAFLLAPLLASFFLIYWNWQQIIQLLAICCLLAACGFFMYGKTNEQPVQPPRFSECVVFFTMPAFWILLLLFGMAITSTIGIYSILPLFLVEEHAMDLGKANYLVSLTRLGTVFTALASGFFSDKFGKRLTITIALLSSGLATILLGLGSGAILILAVFLQPLFAVCFFPAAFAQVATLAPPSVRNLLISVVVPPAFLIGGGLLPALITRMADFQLFSLAILITGVFIASGSFLALLLQDQKTCR